MRYGERRKLEQALAVIQLDSHPPQQWAVNQSGGWFRRSWSYTSGEYPAGRWNKWFPAHFEDPYHMRIPEGAKKIQAVARVPVQWY